MPVIEDLEELKMNDNSHDYHIHVNELSAATKHSLKTRIISAIVGAGTLIPVLFIGDYAFLIYILAILAFCVYEIIHCAGKKYSIWLYIVSFVLP